MKKLFFYNWQVREEWFQWCKQFSSKQLLEKRTGGFGNILHTLLHIVVVEYDWIQDLVGGEVLTINKEEFNTLEDVIQLHQKLHQEVRDFVEGWTDEMGEKTLILVEEGESFNYEEVMNHIIAHEIHHIGQLSVWARELGVAPVTANLIRRGLY